VKFGDTRESRSFRQREIEGLIGGEGKINTEPLCCSQMAEFVHDLRGTSVRIFGEITEKCPLRDWLSAGNRAMCVCTKGAAGKMRHGVSEVQAERLAQDLKNLGTRGDDELKERWRNLYRTEPPGKSHPAVQYYHVDGTPDAQRAQQLQLNFHSSIGSSSTRTSLTASLIEKPGLAPVFNTKVVSECLRWVPFWMLNLAGSLESSVQ
jgi:hypothetical protein